MIINPLWKTRETKMNLHSCFTLYIADLTCTQGHLRCSYVGKRREEMLLIRTDADSDDDDTAMILYC